jgi:hypothetical protein
VKAELIHADRQTDMKKLTVAFRNIANAPKNQWNDVMQRRAYEVKRELALSDDFYSFTYNYMS